MESLVFVVTALLLDKLGLRPLHRHSGSVQWQDVQSVKANAGMSEVANGLAISRYLSVRSLFFSSDLVFLIVVM